MYKIITLLMCLVLGSLTSCQVAKAASLKAGGYHEAPESVYADFGIVQGRGIVILEPDGGAMAATPNPSNWIWIIVRTNGVNADLSDAAFAKNTIDRPTQGRNECHAINTTSGDTLFASGFEGHSSAIADGTWVNNPSGSQSWETDTNVVFHQITEPGTYRCWVSFYTEENPPFPAGPTIASFTFEIE